MSGKIGDVEMEADADVELVVADAIFFVALGFRLLNATASCLSKPACFNLLKSNGILFIILLDDAAGILQDSEEGMVCDCDCE